MKRSSSLCLFVFCLCPCCVSKGWFTKVSWYNNYKSILVLDFYFCTLSYICCPVAFSAPGQSEYAHVFQNIIWYSDMAPLLREFPVSSVPHRHICAADLPTWHYKWCQYYLVMSHPFVMSCFTLIKADDNDNADIITSAYYKMLPLLQVWRILFRIDIGILW